MQVREDARVRAAESLAVGDFADAVEWLRHWARHDSVPPGHVADQYADLVRDAILRRDLDLATAATDYAQQAGLLSLRQGLMLRAGAQIVGGDIAAGLTLTLPLLIDRHAATNLELAVNLEGLGRYLDVVGRGDLAAEYRRCAADMDWEDTPPAYAVADLPEVYEQSTPNRDPMPPQIAALCELVVADSVFAVPYVPYSVFEGRTGDGMKSTKVFDAMCGSVEQSLRPLDSSALALFVVPADDAALYAFAADRKLDPREAWTATLWAGQQAKAGHGTQWPPDSYDACWCGRPVLYDDCCRRWRA